MAFACMGEAVRRVYENIKLKENVQKGKATIARYIPFIIGAYLDLLLSPLCIIVGLVVKIPFLTTFFLTDFLFVIALIGILIKKRLGSKKQAPLTKKPIILTEKSS